MSTFGGVAYAGEAYVGAAGAAAPASASPIEFLLYDPLNQNYLGLLDKTTGRKWNDPFNDAGAGEFEIHADHPLALSALTDGAGAAVYDNIVRCRLNGVTRYAFIIKKNTKRTAKADEEVGKVLAVGGPGTLAFFRRATVYPERGIGRISPDNRLFNWTAFSFNDAAWPAASQLTRYDDSGSGSPWNSLYGIFPRDFPDPTAYWIWGASGSATANAPPGDVYFRKRFTLTSTTPAVAVFSTDNGMDVFLDNAYITSKSGLSGAWTQAGRVDLLLDQGEHLIAIKGHNGSLDELGIGPVLNVGGTLFALHANAFGGGTGGTDFGPLILHSDSSWKVLQYPPGGPPGMTPGEVLRVLFTEAQSRGALPGVTWTFTDANDSAGAPWATTPDLGVQVGTTYEAMLRQLAEVACDLHMDPQSLRLDVLNARGAASSAALAIGSNITDLEHQGDGDITNAAILRFSSGWREASDTSSITAHGRHEGFLSLGTAPSQEQGQLAAQALFADAGRPRDAIVVTHEGPVGSGEEPYADYDVADTITAPARDGQATSQVVKAITVSEDAEGNPIFVPELQSLSDAFEGRLQRWLKRMSAGTVSGQSENASPFIASSSQQDKVSPPEAISQGAGFRYATVVVAASNSLHPGNADFVCTGTNDHLTIIAALDSLPEGTGSGVDGKKGGRVLLMEGTYNIGDRIKHTSASSRDQNVTIEGQGTSTILAVTANITGGTGGGAVIDMQTLTGNLFVRNLLIDGGAFTVDHVIKLMSETSGWSVCSDLRIRNFTVNTSTIRHGFNESLVERCHISVITGDGVKLNNANHHVRSCSIDVSGKAISGVVSGHGFVFSNYLKGLTGGIADAHALVCVGNRIQSKTGSAIQVGSGAAQESLIANNWINLITGVGSGCHEIELIGNYGLVIGNRLWGFNSTSFDAINVQGDEWTIAANEIGLEVAGSQQPRTGIRIESTADRTAVVGNVLRRLTTALNDLGTNTQLSYSGGASGDNLVF